MRWENEAEAGEWQNGPKFGEWKDGYVVNRMTDGSIEWTYFPHDIVGFDFQPGTEYLIYLRIYDVKDSEGNKVKEYRLHNIVSETPKEQSTNFPTSERGMVTIAGEMRQDYQGKHWYACKFKEADGDWAEEWELLIAEEQMLDKFAIETGYEYVFEYHSSSVGADGKSVTGSVYYRFIERTGKEEKIYDDLPGYPIEEDTESIE